MLGCCEVAIGALALNAVSLAIYAGYNIKLKAKEAQLEKRTQVLEKKNGSEQRQINELKGEIKKLRGSQPNNPIPNQEQAAIDYVNNVILPKAQGIVVQGFWQGAVLNYLKQQALNFVGSTLKKLALEKLVDLADWLLEELQDYLWEQYQQASPQEQAIFKAKILEKFPESKLAQGLKGENHD